MGRAARATGVDAFFTINQGRHVAARRPDGDLDGRLCCRLCGRQRLRLCAAGIEFRRQHDHCADGDRGHHGRGQSYCGAGCRRFIAVHVAILYLASDAPGALPPPRHSRCEAIFDPMLSAAHKSSMQRCRALEPRYPLALGRNRRQAPCLRRSVRAGRIRSGQERQRLKSISHSATTMGSR